MHALEDLRVGYCDLLAPDFLQRQTRVRKLDAS
jgi:hypothetical protein